MANRISQRTLAIIATCFGMIVGGLVQQVGRMFLPGGAAKEFLTSGLTWTSGPTRVLNLFFLHVGAGPFAMDISLAGAAAGIAAAWFFYRVLQ
jgi:hypothetical protein